MENQNFTAADLYANWLMDIAEALKDFANLVEGDAIRYFNIEPDDDLGLGSAISDNPQDPIESEQELASNKAEYLDRLIAELGEHLKSL